MRHVTLSPSAGEVFAAHVATLKYISYQATQQTIHAISPQLYAQITTVVITKRWCYQSFKEFFGVEATLHHSINETVGLGKVQERAQHFVQQHLKINKKKKKQKKKNVHVNA